MIKAREANPVEGISRMGRWALPGLRWWILGLIFCATVINLMDRLTVSVLAPVICEKLHLTNLDYAKVGTWFLLAYTISQGLSGLMHDRMGVRRGFAVSVTVWSAAALLHAFARSFAVLCTFRVFLGLGEGGNWPGAIKVITEWFPARERAFALGVVNGGSSAGAILAPPAIIWLQFQFGWQSAFLATGSLGFIWLLAWLLFYRSCDQHRWLGSGEFQYIRVGQDRTMAPDASTHGHAISSWFELFALRQVWAIVLARFLVDPVWWLYILWLPEYLSKARGMSLQQIGVFAPLPFIAAGMGGLAGGALSGYLMGQGWSRNRARKTVILLAACFMPFGILVTHAGSTIEAILWISLVTFGFQFWSSNVSILPSDIFPSHQVASVAGLGGVGAGMGSMAFTMTTGWVVDHFSYTPILITAGLLCPLGSLALFSLIGEIKPLGNNRELDCAGSDVSIPR